MGAKLVAMVWWTTSEDHALERMMFDDHCVTFGRHVDANVRIGHVVDGDPTVPRWWGRLDWVDGRLRIANLDDRWSFDLVPTDTPASTRVTVHPQFSVSPPFTRFRIVADAPESHHKIEVRSAAPTPLTWVADPAHGQDPPSYLPFALNLAQKAICEAMLTAHRGGHSRRPSYEDLAETTNYSLRHVRETVRELDSLFLLHGLAAIDPRSGALDRIDTVVARHPGMLH